MIKEFYLPGLNSQSKKNFTVNERFEEIKETVSQTTHAVLYEFLHHSNYFYRKHFNALEKCKIREKRLIDFETPNRAKIIHEYDINVSEENQGVYNDLCYLFNPRNRLSWLKVKQEGKRILIVSNNTIKELVMPKLEADLTALISDKTERELFFNYIWENQVGYPCFTKIENIGQNKFLIEAEYYDSIKEDPRSTKKGNIFSPFEERNISYEYFPLRNYSSWLYVRAPQKFNLTLDDKDLEYDKSVNKVECYSEGKNHDNSDPEIKTLTIVNLRGAEEENYIVKLKIGIRIPKSLRIWFLSLYSVAFTVVCLSLINIINHIYLKFCNPIFNINYIGKLVNSSGFQSIMIALFAAVIATRGWMISEETILKKYSNYLTFIMFSLIMLPIILSIIR